MTRPYHSATETDRCLRRHLEDIRSGISDTDLSKKTGLSPRTIKRWRLREGIQKPRGTSAVKLADAYAISTFGEALGDVKQRTTKSAVSGAWEPPTFVTREHINYDNFLRLLDAGYRLAGMTAAELTSALGMSSRSVEQGLAIYNANRSTTAKCLTCEEQALSTSQFCSGICSRLYGKKTT